MNEYYHVSYKNLSKNQILSLNNSSYKAEYKAEGFYNDPEVRKTIIKLFPNGISQHGINYLNQDFISPLLNNVYYIQHILMIEATFEYIRQIKFNNLPSRFESVFACKTLEEALKYKQGYREVSSAKIYKITGDLVFEADMNLLKMGHCILGNYTMAEKYWNGEVSENPFMEVLLKGNVKVIEEITT